MWGSGVVERHLEMAKPKKRLATGEDKVENCLVILQKDEHNFLIRL